MEFVTEALGLPVTRTVWPQQNQLPLFLLEKYRFEQVNVGGTLCLFLQPLQDVDPINVIQKHLKRIGSICSWPIVLELSQLTRQRRKTLIAARIPFVVPGKQLYLPFLGAMLSEKCDAAPAQTKLAHLQPSAQQLLFAWILEGCPPQPMAPLAKRFGVSAMTISRAVAQLCETGLVSKSAGAGAQKILMTAFSPKELYQRMHPFLIQPVRKTVYLDRQSVGPEMFPAGLSVLAEETMLNPPAMPVWGTAAQEELGPSATPQLLNAETQCVLQIWKYDPRKISRSSGVDALSLALTLENDPDERTQQCLQEWMERTWNTIC